MYKKIRALDTNGCVGCDTYTVGDLTCNLLY